MVIIVHIVSDRYGHPNGYAVAIFTLTISLHMVKCFVTRYMYIYMRICVYIYTYICAGAVFCTVKS